MMPGLDPQKMARMLKQMGMKMDNVSATQVVIKTETGNITIEEPQVVRTSMKGQVIFQVSGKITEQVFSAEDIKLVMEQSGIKDEKRVKKALEETSGDIVEAIIKLKED